jgi:hypothetical protein
MSEERFQDEPVVGDEIVRGFMFTKGRTRAHQASELSLETIVSLTPTASSMANNLQFERRAIVRVLDETSSVAEIAAKLGIPLRAALVIVSEMVADGLLTAEEVVVDVDLPLLHKIREAIAAL